MSYYSVVHYIGVDIVDMKCVCNEYTWMLIAIPKLYSFCYIPLTKVVHSQQEQFYN